MGFLDDLKKGADNLAGKANTALSGNQAAGQPGAAAPVVPSDNYFHDLGVLVYQERTGRATEQTAAEIERVYAGLQDNEQNGRPTNFVLRTGAPPPPGAGQPPPPSGSPVAAPPPPGGAVSPPPPPGGAVQPPPAPAGAPVAAPPPPGGAVQPPPAPAAPAAPVAPPPPPGTVAPPPPPGSVGGTEDDNPTA